MNYVDFSSPSKTYENKSERYEYRLSDYIGHGAFGTVYKAFDYQNQEYVALKLINKNIQMNNFEKLLQQEISTLQKVPSKSEVEDFQYLIKYKDYYITDLHYVIVMELFEQSEELYKYLENKGGRLHEDHALDIFNQITKGIYALHKLNIAHRDIKPQNVLIKTKPKLQIKIVDFGYAKKFKSDNDLTLSLAGSPIYMSPQNLFQVGYNPYSNDIWGLGILLYQMVTGGFPWQAKTGKELDMQLMKYISQEIGLRATQLTMYTREIVTDCLKVNEKDRISISDLKWKVDKIIQETIKQSYESDIQLPKFNWGAINQLKPKLKFMSEADLLVIQQHSRKENIATAIRIMEIHTKFLRDLIQPENMFKSELVELDDYLGIFGFIMTKVTKQSLENTVNYNKLDVFWQGISKFVRQVYQEAGQDDQSNNHMTQCIEMLTKILSDYRELGQESSVCWEHDRNFVKLMKQQAQIESTELQQEYLQSFRYLQYLFNTQSDNYISLIQQIL